jgi:AraC-like DNA-binding protein
MRSFKRKRRRLSPQPVLDPTGTFDPLAGLEGAAMPRVIGAAIDYRAGTELAWHSHGVGQLIYAAIGSMTVRTEDDLFIVPPLMAVWVAPAVAHAIAMRNRVAMRTLYFRSDALPLPDQRCGVLRVSPLLRELILTRVADGSTERPLVGALDTLIAYEMQAANFEPLVLKAPNDRRVRRIVAAILEQPADSRSLAEWSRAVGASPRTIERIFLRETLLTFRQWRQQARLLQAVLLLSEDRPVTEVALDVGYGSQSAFTYMFRRALGVAPTRYFTKTE